MSLGGPPDTPDLLAQAVDNVDESGAAVVAVAAGNGGPGRMTVASPGSAARALTAGASSVGHFLAAPLTVGGSDVSTAKGDFDLPSSPVTAPLAVVEEAGSLGPACNALPGGSLTGAIAVVTRGSCVFSQKASVAKAAGAVAVVVVNNVAGDPVGMARSAGFDDALPAVMASLADRDALIGANGSDATLGSELTYTRSSNSDIMGAFSGQGPTPGDFRVKPDVVAPGVNVLSSVPNDGWAFLQGTSMATPHLAGMAAVVRGAHPDWTPEQVRSAIVNTAATDRLKDFETAKSVVTDVNVVGAGIAQLSAAVNADVALAPVSVSFGQVAPGVTPDPATVTLSALNGSVPSDAAVDNDAFAVSSSGDTLTVTFDPSKADPGDGPGETATLTVGSAHAVLYAEVP
jgi:subtilisin family serine protease